MNIRLKDIKKINKKGIYAIKNIKNNKVYIGSTRTSFKSRLESHEFRLKANNHENIYLQRAYNKDKKFFEFRILFICDKNDEFEWEQRAFNLYQPFQERGYNMNKIAFGPPKVLSKEVIDRRSKTFKSTINTAMKYYHKLKNGEINEEDIPKKYKKLALSYVNRKVWNKGKKYKSTDHLKVPKKTKGCRKNFKISMLQKADQVLVYDLNMNFLGKWNSAMELDEWSLTDSNDLPIVTKKPRKGCVAKQLNAFNVRKCARLNKPYKGLFFKLEPSKMVTS